MKMLSTNLRVEHFYICIYRRANGIPKSCNLQHMDSLSLFNLSPSITSKFPMGNPPHTHNLFFRKSTYAIESINLSYDGGGAQSAPPIFICENNRKSNKIMHCVVKKKIRLVVLKIRPFFT